MLKKIIQLLLSDTAKAQFINCHYTNQAKIMCVFLSNWLLLCKSNLKLNPKLQKNGIKSLKSNLGSSKSTQYYPIQIPEILLQNRLQNQISEKGTKPSQTKSITKIQIPQSKP